MGAPSVYFVWSVPQDGIAKPADFNASASVYLRMPLERTRRFRHAPEERWQALTGRMRRLLHRDADGRRRFRPTPSMLTGGLGYSYNVTTHAAADADQPGGVSGGDVHGGGLRP